MPHFVINCTLRPLVVGVIPVFSCYEQTHIHLTFARQTLDCDHSQNQEALFGVVGHMMSGKSFELILTAAAATDKLLVFVGELIRSGPRQQCALFLVDVQRSRNVSCGCVTCIHLTCCVWVFDVDELLCDALRRLNEFARQASGEGGRQAAARSLLFDMSFLMLCHITQTYGLGVSLPPSAWSFIRD